MGREAHERGKACSSRVEEEVRRSRMLVQGLCRQQVLLGKDRGSLAASMDFDKTDRHYRYMSMEGHMHLLSEVRGVLTFWVREPVL